MTGCDLTSAPGWLKRVLLASPEAIASLRPVNTSTHLGQRRRHASVARRAAAYYRHRP